MDSTARGDSDQIRLARHGCTVSIGQTDRSYANKKARFTLHMAKSKAPQGLSKNVEYYLKKRELDRLKETGASYDELKTAIINGTNSKTSNGKTRAAGYQRFVGKGSLDQRLRAIVAYKRSNVAGEMLSDGFTVQEEEELEEIMDSDEDDDELEIDDEEAYMEQLVMGVIEEAKLSELKKNFLLDKAALRSIDIEENVSDNETIESKLDTASQASEATANNNTIPEDDMYTPATSSWGVFKRPRDISKTYGGGRTITREEMKRMDEEFAQREKETTAKNKVFVNEAMRVEYEKEDKIKDSLSRARGLMGIGNTHGAVALLESVKEYLSWQSDLGGEVWLEYAMALETVDRSDEARKVYGKLITTTWNQKTRRNAMQLLQGLDITAKIKSNMTPVKPVVDFEAMYSISKALEKGLTNEWDDYKKDRKRDNLLPWYDEEIMKENKNLKVENLEDAYLMLMRLANPLKEITPDLINRAFKKVYASNETERVRFFRRRGVISSEEKVAMPSYTSFNTAVSNDATSGAFSGFRGDLTTEWSNKKETKPKVVLKTSSDAYGSFINGSWDLVASLKDRAPYRVTRYDTDSLIRTFTTAKNICSETVPTFWGFSSATTSFEAAWDPNFCEISLDGENLIDSIAPYQRKRQRRQTFQVTKSKDSCSNIVI